MKKFIAILLILVFTLSLVSCKNAYTDAVEQLEAMNFSGYFYTESQIKSMRKENKITENITAFANFSSVDEEGNELVLFVAAFDTEEEAESYLADHTLGWKYAFATDNVVIYGNNSAINDLDL